MTEATYDRTDFSRALQEAGVQRGDTLFVHANLEALGRASLADGDGANGLVLTALREAVGPAGTLVLPTYTFSFCRQEVYDPLETPTAGGPWSPSASLLEEFRRLPGAVRSLDPIHSVAALGPRAGELLEEAAPTCFGRGSVFERLLKAGARICMIGLGLDEATFRHHTEELWGVPFRFRKLFTGKIRKDGRERKLGWVYNVRILAENGYPDGTRVARLATESGRERSARIGAGHVTTITCQDLHAVTLDLLRRDPWATARGPAGDPVHLERERVNAPEYKVELSSNASMREMVEKLWWIPRNILSEGFDAALGAISSQLPMTIQEYPTGSECWTWIIPEKWVCHEAFLETLDGRRIFSTDDHPLHVVQYSLPYDGVVGKDELLAHLHVHAKRPDAVPYIFKYYERDWGLCCSQRQRDALTEDRYRVVIRSDFSFGTMRVGEVVAPGRTDRSIVLCSHLCHPAQAMDDLSGVVVGVEVIRRLLQRRNLRYTYRYLIVPETIGSVAWLASNGELIPKIKGGLYLEMLGLDQPHALQATLSGDTGIDRAFGLGLSEADPQAWKGPWRTVIGNDERQFNAPGVRIPMASLSRVRHPEDADWPYPEYHSSHDGPGLVSDRRLADSVEAVLRMIDTLEADRVPVNLYQGEVFCSRYGLHIDPYTNLEGHNALFRLMDLIDGSRTISELALACGISFSAARGVVEELERFGLVRYREPEDD